MITLRLPFLHPDSRPSSKDSYPGAMYFRPGALEDNTDQAQYWTPDNLPLSASQVAGFLCELEGLGSGELSTLLHALNTQAKVGDGATRAEMRGLAAFAATGTESDFIDAENSLKNDLALERSQKILLWCWLQEKRLAELTGLIAACRLAENRIAQALADDGNIAQAENAALFRIDPALYPPWRICVASASMFIPHNQPVLAEGEMALELRDMLDMTDNGAGFLVARAPLWQALGHSPGSCLCLRDSLMKEIYGHERVWLVESVK